MFSLFNLSCQRRGLMCGALVLAVLATGCGDKTASTVETAASANQTSSIASASQKASAINVSPNDDRKYSTFVLPNGLEVIVVSDKEAELAAVSVSVAAGSYQDPDAHLGLAHYLEHMLFLGNEKYPEANSLQKFVDLNGGAWNAYTAPDHTNYFFQIKADKLAQALDNFSQYFISPKLDQTYADKERNAVNSEWSMGRTHDGWIIQRVSGLTGNPKNPAARISVGNLETLQDTEDSKLQDALWSFYNRYYSANLMKLVLVSNEPIEKLEAMVNEYFSAVPNRNAEMPKVIEPGITASEQGQHIHVKTLRDIKTLQIVFPVANNAHQWREKPNTYIENLLSSEEPGTLGKVLRDQGLAQTVSVWSDPERYGSDGVFAINIVMTEKGMTARDEIIAATFAYIDLVKKSGVQEAYYNELKAIAEQQFAEQPKTPSLALARELAAKMLDLPSRHVLDASVVFAPFNAEVINSVLAQMTPERARIFHIDNTEEAQTPIPFYEGAYRVRKFTDDELVKWRELAKTFELSLPPLNDLFTAGQGEVVESTLLTPKTILNEAGIEAFLTHADAYRENKGVLWLELNNPVALESANTYTYAQILSIILNQQQLSLIDKAARAGIEISITQGDTGSLAVRLGGFTQKHEQLLSELVDDIKKLKISPDDFIKAQEIMVNNIKNLAKNPPFQQGISKFNQVIRPDVGFESEALLAAAEGATREEIEQYHNRQLADHLLRVYAFGNYQEQSLVNTLKQIQKTLGSSRKPESRLLATYLPSNAQLYAPKADVDPTDNALVVSFIAEQPSLKDSIAARLLSSVYSNSAFTQLRTEEQLGYVVNGRGTDINERATLLMFVQSNNTALVPLAARINRFHQEFSQVMADLTDEDFEQLRKAEIAALTEKPVNFYAEATRFMGDFNRADYRFNRRERELAELNRITKEDLQRVYQTLVGDQRGSRIFVQIRGKNFAKEPYAADELIQFKAATPAAKAE
ncbi:MAG: insulinase family protein [Cellvibrio sp.]